MTQDIRHLVVLMLENRSYDNLIGYLSQQLPGLDGLAPGMTNPLNPSVPASPVVPFCPARSDVINPDPDHDFDGATLQLFGSTHVPTPPAATCNGYVASHTQTAKGSTLKGAEIMQCFEPSRVPALATLAAEFAVCDRWFSSVPGPTWPNRFFAHCATSDGLVENKVFTFPLILRKYAMPSIFEALQGAGFSWKVFFHDIPQSAALTNLRKRSHRGGFARIKHFYKAAAEGSLPAYSFIEPQYFNYDVWRANDQHGGHSVSLGDTLVAHVYEALRQNAETWPHTMLLIVHDEHGGFFDHVAPPYDGMPTPAGHAVVHNPDGKVSQKPAFDFQRLGARVPAVVVSPFVPRGAQDHRMFEHSSIPATVRAIRGIALSLNTRDATANPFHDIASLAEMRGDTPLRLPRANDIDAAREFELRTYEMDDAAQHIVAEADQNGEAPLNELQITLNDLSAALGGAEPQVEAAGVVTERRAAREIKRRMDKFLSPEESSGQTR